MWFVGQSNTYLMILDEKITNLRQLAVPSAAEETKSLLGLPESGRVNLRTGPWRGLKVPLAEMTFVC